MRFVGIDPATKTGFVALGPDGMPVKSKEITGNSKQDPERMATLIDNIIYQVEQDDIICIEGIPYSTQRAVFAGGLHYGIRCELWKRGIRYYEVNPSHVKKFVDVTGWTGDTGNKRRLQGKEKKQAVMDSVKQHYGFVHSSDNVVDAYIMAQIAKSMHTKKVAYEHQLSVVENLKLA
jgi:crossover junction endodeoxyribonuclease RuvC